MSEDEIDAYIGSFGRTFTFYALEASGNVAAEDIKAKDDRYVSAFEDFSGPLRHSLAGLSLGETTSAFVTGNEKIRIYLEKIEGEPEQRQYLDRKFIRMQLRQEKIEKHITAWVERLRQNATITYHSNRD